MQERLLVLPNPYTFIDGDGEPQGACPADPDHAAGKRMWVGAKLDPQRTKFLEDHKDRRNGLKWKGDPRPRPQAVKFTFSARPVEIPSTPHYLDRIREGSLIAADAETFAKAFGGRAKYVAPVLALAEARRRAFDEHKAATGQDPAFTREEGTAARPADSTAVIDGPEGRLVLPPPDIKLPPIARSSADTAPAEAPGGTK
jgi:hypothetical protein